MATSTEVMATPLAEQRWRPTSQGWAIRIGVAAALIALVLWRMATVSGVWADHFSVALIFAIIGLSLNIVLGYTGQVSLGHHAFVGLSAFVAAHHVTVRAGCAPENGCIESPLGAFFTALFLATLVGALAAGILGMIALRIKGLYLALITLTYGFVAVNSLFELPDLTRGGAGMPAPRPKMFFTDHRYMLLCALLLGVLMFIDWRLLKSKVGRAILAVKESEAVAASYAVNVTVYKVLAFTLSGAFAGLAGALFAYRRQIVVANDFGFQFALIWVLMVVVGGLGSRLGVVIGSMFFALFPFLIELVKPLQDLVGDQKEQVTLVIGPLLALITMIQFPGGIAEQISPITRWLGGEKFSMHPDGKKKKSHHGLLQKLGIKKGKAHEAAPEIVAPVVSQDLLSPTSGVLSGDADHTVETHENGVADDAATAEQSAVPTDETATAAVDSAGEDGRDEHGTSEDGSSEDPETVPAGSSKEEA